MNRNIKYDSVLMPIDRPIKKGDLFKFDQKLYLAKNGDAQLKPSYLYITADIPKTDGDVVVFDNFIGVVKDCDDVNKAPYNRVMKIELFNGDIYEVFDSKCKKVVASNDARYTPHSMISDNSMEEYIGIFNAGRDVAIHYVQYEMTGGWVPSYNNPDNIDCHEPAEPTGFMNIGLMSMPKQRTYTTSELIQKCKEVIIKEREHRARCSHFVDLDDLEAFIEKHI